MGYEVRLLVLYAGPMKNGLCLAAFRILYI